MATLFTSDLHVQHKRVAELRGFETTAAHDAAIAANWEAVVREEDVVWVLGDLAMSSPDAALALLASLPGRKRLVLGNHDAAHPMHRDAPRYLRRYLEAFEHVASAARIRVEGREVLLSHFPYERDRHETRHAQWRLRDEGLPLIHGHTHGPERLTVSAPHVAIAAPRRVGSVPYRRFEAGAKRVEVHVGLDAWDLKPVRLETVAELLEEALG